MWLDKPEQWEALCTRLRQAGEFGLDTETYGQPDKTSPQHRARVHCWSVGVLTETRSPRGYRRAIGRVLPVRALEAPCVRSLLGDPSVTKWAHNAPHDRHSLENRGVHVASMHDTLQWLRVAVPGMGDYGLKGAERWALGYGPRPEFWDMMGYWHTVVRSRSHKEKGCICGKKPCHSKGTSDWFDSESQTWKKHTRVEWRVFTPVRKDEYDYLTVPDFVPGADLPPLEWRETKDTPYPPGWWVERGGRPTDRMAEWWNYSVQDAIRGMELVDWMRTLKVKELVYPWTPRPPRYPGAMPSPNNPAS